MGPIRSARLQLRPWRLDDAEALEAAVLEDVAYLARWLPWAEAEPLSLEQRRDVLRGFVERHAAGQEYLFGIWRDDHLVGGIGLHLPLRDAEIGYWLRPSATRQGLATEAVTALIEAARAAGLGPFMIRHAPTNDASEAIPRRLGFNRDPQLQRHGDDTLVVWRSGDLGPRSN